MLCQIGDRSDVPTDPPSCARVQRSFSGAPQTQDLIHPEDPASAPQLEECCAASGMMGGATEIQGDPPNV